MSLLASGERPGWPARLGPLRVAAGVVTLRPIRWRDAGAWSRLRIRDENYLRPWEPDAPGTWADRCGVGAWPGQCGGLRALARRGRTLPMAIVVDGAFAGQLTLGNIVHGSLGSCWVGYWVDSERAGGGVATAAVALVVDHAFGSVGLHRISATVRPENVASAAVLAKLGFRHEGRLVRYLKVDGEWRDHDALAITTEETGTGLVAALLRSGRASLV